VNAALLLMTSTFVAGADAPAAAPMAPAAVASCGASCDPCCSKGPSLLDRMKSRMGCHKHKRGNDCCAAAPTCCAPAPAPKCCAPAPKPKCCAPAPAPTCCDTCDSARPNLLDRIKAKWQSKKHKHDCCAPACDGCSAAPAGPAPPVNMPTPTPKPMGAKSVSESAPPAITIPTPGATLVPSVPTIPVTPVSGAKAYSPY
jgi:hypothetical protein